MYDCVLRSTQLITDEERGGGGGEPNLSPRSDRARIALCPGQPNVTTGNSSEQHRRGQPFTLALLTQLSKSKFISKKIIF